MENNLSVQHLGLTYGIYAYYYNAYNRALVIYNGDINVIIYG